MHVPDTQVGLFLVGNGLMVMLLQLPVAYLLDRRSKVVALAVGAGLFAASSTTLLVTDSFLGILMAFARFFTLAEMTVEVAGHLWPRRTSPPRETRHLPRPLRVLPRRRLWHKPHSGRSTPRLPPPTQRYLAGSTCHGDTGDRRAPGARQAEKTAMSNGRRRADRFSRTRNTRMATSSREPFS